ncbi:MAG: hypothetical protein CM15mP120_00390 [Pseudomonadota bacterium]|nr:MAG: hypothetical protein CM15mP120_00390 [Pseudomonadota bacterium]
MCAEQPLGLGWLTLIPKHAQHPIARTFLHKREGGEFLIAKENGPIVGRILCKSIGSASRLNTTAADATV